MPGDSQQMEFEMGKAEEVDPRQMKLPFSEEDQKRIEQPRNDEDWKTKLLRMREALPQGV